MFRKSEQHGIMKELPIAEVPDFSFTTQEGKTLTKADLLGKVWVVNFIFTRCSGPCPIMTSHMMELASKVTKIPEVKLVSVSVDPTYDTPEVLAQYANNIQVNPEQWYFLTGSLDKITAFTQQGMKQSLVTESGSMPNHSTRFMIVDQAGMIRSYHDVRDSEVVQKILIDIGNLVRHPATPSRP
jgi:protein SCO1/2